MIAAEVSGLSLAGAVVYLLTAVAAAIAAVSADRRGRGNRDQLAWVLVLLAFVVFSAMRLVAAEEHLRSTLRTALELADARAGRRAIQLPLSLLALTLATLAAFPLVRRIAASGWASQHAARNWALLALLGMLGLIALRIISLHAMDAILFSSLIGPLRLNWLLDLGFTAVALLAAINFVVQARRV